MAELRRDYREQLVRLEDTILEMGDAVVDMTADSVGALVRQDKQLADEVIAADDRLDRTHAALQVDLLRTLALQAPVASDLRFLGALIHISIHLERIGDQCVNIAKTAKRLKSHPDDPEVYRHIEEMARHARTVTRHALDAFRARDVDGARRLERLDDPVDELNRTLFRQLVQVAASDETLLDWAMRMVLVTRYLERIGDHAVDIGDQTVFVVTGNTPWSAEDRGQWAGRTSQNTNPSRSTTSPTSISIGE